jgi:hypothetical protein
VGLSAGKDSRIAFLLAMGPTMTILEDLLKEAGLDAVPAGPKHYLVPAPSEPQILVGITEEKRCSWISVAVSLGTVSPRKIPCFDLLRLSFEMDLWKGALISTDPQLALVIELPVETVTPILLRSLIGLGRRFGTGAINCLRKGGWQILAEHSWQIYRHHYAVEGPLWKEAAEMAGWSILSLAEHVFLFQVGHQRIVAHHFGGTYGAYVFTDILVSNKDWELLVAANCALEGCKIGLDSKKRVVLACELYCPDHEVSLIHAVHHLARKAEELVPALETLSGHTKGYPTPDFPGWWRWLLGHS